MCPSEIQPDLFEIQVPWMPTRLWWVPTEAARVELLGEGVAAGRIWTYQELAELLLRTRDRDQVQFAVAAKLAFDGELAPVESPR